VNVAVRSLSATSAALSTNSTSGAALLVRFAAGTSATREQADLAAMGGTVVETVTNGPDLVVLAPGTTSAVAQGILLGKPEVLYAALNMPATPTTLPTGPGPATIFIPSRRRSPLKPCTDRVGRQSRRTDPFRAGGQAG